MKPTSNLRAYRVALASAAAIVALLATPALAQPTYSIDFQGPSAPFGGGATPEGDILTPVGAGTVPPPMTVLKFGDLGIGPTAPGFVELDALSYGREPPLAQFTADGILLVHEWQFSVDEFAVGLPAVPAPSVTTEGAFGLLEASGDIYGSATPAGPVPPFAGGNTGVWDGNGGTTPFLAPGLNLVEPNPPSPGSLPDDGDNLDAWDQDTPPPSPGAPGTAFSTPVYFSLDSRFLDPFEPLPANTGTAIANGFVGGDVLISSTSGGPIGLYAPATSLGLSPNDEDDLDALVLWENGSAGYQATTGPYSWLTAATPPTDMLLFSVRRGSSIIGTLDSLQGLPIEEGDVLVPVAGAVPGIFVAAEALGLATFRSGSATFQTGFGDDLDALDVQQVPVPEPSSLILAMAALVMLGTSRRMRAPFRQCRSYVRPCVSASMLAAALLLAANPLYAVPVDAQFIDDTRCDPVPDQRMNHELGDGPAATPFPIDERIMVGALQITDPALLVCVGDDGVANDWEVRMTNLSSIAYKNVFFVVDEAYAVGNADGRAQDLSAPGFTDAFRIDGTVTVTGVNDNLQGEDMTVDEIFEPGESWSFVVTNFTANGPPTFDSIGGFSVSSAGGPPSNASILATPIPEPSTWMLAILGLCMALAGRRAYNR